MDSSLVKLLEQSGFTDKEASVYLALLSLGQGTVRSIARLTELKRPIIYIILEGLIKRGYASELPDKKINTYQALDPQIIGKQLERSAKEFMEMLPILRTLGSKGKKPKISYIDNSDGIWKIYEEFNYQKEGYFFSSYAAIEKNFPGGVEQWLNNYRRGRYPIIGRHLLPDNPAEIKFGLEFAKVKQNVKVLPKVAAFSMDFTLCGNKLALTSFEDETFMVLIESEALAKSMTPFFETVWQAGTEIA